jgi:AcrR family transcriptional regulator
MKSELSPKERIMEKAYELFYTQGYYLTGINQILEESKVAKASLYQHFGSKEDLGVEYIRKVRREWFSSFESFILKKSSARQQLLAAFDFLEQNMDANNYRGCRFINLLNDVDGVSKKMRKEIVDHKTKLRTTFKTLLQKHTSEHGKHLHSSEADTIYLLFEAAIVESKLHQSAWPIQAAKRAVSFMIPST